MTGAAPEPKASRAARLAATVVAVLSTIALAVLFLVRAAQPLGTDDLFWHLALGRHVLDHGRPLQVDVFSHTAAGRPDVPQQWLSEVVYALVERAAGPYGLRLLAGVVFLACVLAAAVVLRRSRASAAPIAAGLALFLVLGWWWLLQLRPHGFSFVALLVLAVLAEGRLSGRRAAAIAVLALVWTNLHAVGLLASLGFVGLAVVELGAARLAPRVGATPDVPFEPARVALVASALLVLSLATPSVLDLWTFSFAHRDDLVLVPDEWSRLDLLHPERMLASLRGPVHAAAVLALVVTAIGAAVALATPEGRRGLVAGRRRVFFALFGLALALSAVRFLFALVLPVAWALTVLGPRLARPWPAIAAALAAALAAGAAFRDLDGRMFHATTFAEWREPWLDRKLFPEAARFLGGAQVEGNLGNSYHLGGQLLAKLHPRLKVFVDARTVVYGRAIIEDAARIALGLDAPALLERYQVDVYVGIGFPFLPAHTGYESLDGAPGWLCVFRSQEVVVSLRTASPRTPANLDRVAAYYGNRGVPFDRTRGFEPGPARDAAPAWAREHRLFPRELEELGDSLAPAERAAFEGQAWRRLGVKDRAEAAFARAAGLRGR